MQYELFFTCKINVSVCMLPPLCIYICGFYFLPVIWINWSLWTLYTVLGFWFKTTNKRAILVFITLFSVIYSWLFQMSFSLLSLCEKNLLIFPLPTKLTALNAWIYWWKCHILVPLGLPSQKQKIGLHFCMSLRPLLDQVLMSITNWPFLLNEYLSPAF